MLNDVPDIAVVDDGELRDVRRLMGEIGVEYTHWTKDSVPAVWRDPRLLLVTSVSAAAALSYRRAPGPSPERAIWIAVADDDSRLAKSVHGWGFDCLVRRPVHPVALRTVILRALYRGTDQRERARVVVGYQTAFRTNRESRDATLVDVGTTGCRLISTEPVPVQSRIAVQFPDAIAGQGFAHPGVVVRAECPGGDDAADEPTTLGVRFARVDSTAKARMLRVLNDLKRGPARMPSAAVSERNASQWVERVPRGIYETHVPILGVGNFFLDGRDLSPQGVRVTTHPALALGANLRLSFACEDGSAPVVVDAEVARSDGPRGTVLCFDWLDDGARGRLVHLVESLPPLGCPQACEDTDTTLRTLVAAVLRR
jgi:hypothetical protein